MRKRSIKIFALFCLCIAVRLLSQSPSASKIIEVGPNVLVSWAGGGSSDELTFAIDPTNPRNMLAAGILFRSTQPIGGQETRAYVSSDGGNTWRPVNFQLAQAQYSGDPIVAFGASGTGFFIYGGGPNSGPHVYVFRSVTHGQTWEDPRALPFIDHEQIAIDETKSEFHGVVYLAGLEEFEGHPLGKEDAHISVYRSADDGRTWSGPVDVLNNHSTSDRRANVDAVATFSDGEVLVFGTDFPAKMEPMSYHYWTATSPDGGRTFSKPQFAQTTDGGIVDGPFNVLPMLAVDQSNSPFRDNLYMIWPDLAYFPGSPGIYSVRSGESPHASRILVSVSSDRGKTWTTPKVISDAPAGSNQYGPVSVAVNRDGVVGVSWYDTRGTPSGHSDLINRYFTASVDGGNSFLPAVRISSKSVDVKESSTHFVGAEADSGVLGLVSGNEVHGEYLGLQADADGSFHQLWSDARTGSAQIWTASIVVRLKGEQHERTTLTATDVSKDVDLWIDPAIVGDAGTLSVPIRIRNISSKTLFAPIHLKIISQQPGESLIEVDGKSQNRAADIDYSHALGDWSALPPGGVSEALVWKFKTPKTMGTNPSLKFEVSAGLELPDKLKK